MAAAILGRKHVARGPRIPLRTQAGSRQVFTQGQSMARFFRRPAGLEPRHAEALPQQTESLGTVVRHVKLFRTEDFDALSIAFESLPGSSEAHGISSKIFQRRFFRPSRDNPDIPDRPYRALMSSIPLRAYRSRTTTPRAESCIESRRHLHCVSALPQNPSASATQFNRRTCARAFGLAPQRSQLRRRHRRYLVVIVHGRVRRANPEERHSSVYTSQPAKYIALDYPLGRPSTRSPMIFR